MEAAGYKENEAAYLAMGITKVNNGEVGRVALDSNNYEAKINHIAISHQRTRAPYGPLAEGKQTISRSELGKLM